MNALNLLKIICTLLLLIVLVSGRTVTHYKTSTDANGNKNTSTWTSEEPDDDDNAFGTGFPLSVASRFSGTSSQTETVRVGGSSPDQVKQAAIEKGMDPVAVAELLAHKQPVIQTSNDKQGQKITITYDLDADGSISRKTVTEGQQQVLPTRLNFDLHEPRPITRTTTQQTAGTDKKKIDSDWEWNPQSNPFDSPPLTRTFTRTWHSETPTIFRSPSGVPTFWTSTFDTPTAGEPTGTTHTRFPDTWATSGTHWPTFGAGKPDGPTITTNSARFPDSWASRGTPSFWQTFGNDYEGRIKPAEPPITTTTVKLPESWDPSTWPIYKKPDTEIATTVTPTSTATTTTKTKTTTASTSLPQPRTTTPLPSLEDFLKAQYGNSTKRKMVERDHSPNTPATTTTTTTTAINTSRKPIFTTTTPSVFAQPETHTIKLEDLPVTEILHNGQPLDSRLLHKLPGGSLPKPPPLLPTDNNVKIQNIPMSIVPHETEPQLETVVRSYTKTLHSAQPPTAADLDPKMRDALLKAGISPDDIKSMKGDTITKTRVEPDGRTITTTYRIKSTPVLVASPDYDSPKPLPIIPQQVTPTVNSKVDPLKNWYATPTTYDAAAFEPWQHKFSYDIPSLTPTTVDFESNLKPISPIAQFLAKIGLSMADIREKNGVYQKNIIDEDGHVLAVNLVLSSVKNNKEQNKHKEARSPIK